MGTPVIWANLVFVSSAVPVGVSDAEAHAARSTNPGPHKYVVMALDRKDGRVVWERVAREDTPHESAHQEWGTWASPSVVTDGTHVIASFESRGIFAYDMKGTPIWQKDLGDKSMRNQFGEGSSPALHGNSLVIVWDHQGGSFIVVLDKRTGEERWRVARDEIDSWATPLVVEAGGVTQVVTNGTKQVRSYDLQTGALLWFGQGTTMNAIPSPVRSEGLVIVTAGFRGNNLKAVRLADAKGDITNTPALVWSLDRDTPYVPSPLLYDGILYLLKSNNGLLSAFDAQSGKPHYQVTRLEAAPNIFASPVGAAGRVYIPGQQGHDGRAQARTDFRGRRREQARRRLQCVAGAGRWRALSQRQQVVVLHRRAVDQCGVATTSKSPWTTLPPTIVISTLSLRTSSVGTVSRSPDSTMRSASLPGSRLPRLSSSNVA